MNLSPYASMLHKNKAYFLILMSGLLFDSYVWFTI